MNFWYMQLHPGEDSSKDYSIERMLETIVRYRDVGMGDEKQWYNRGLQEVFISRVKNGDVVAVGKGKRLFALVRIIGERKPNCDKNESHWYGLTRPVEILSLDPTPAMQRFVNEYQVAPIMGLPFRKTISKVNKNQFVRYWYENLHVDLDGVITEPQDMIPERVARKSYSLSRNSSVVEAALKIGHCERCGVDATFERRDGSQYFEVHHCIKLSSQGEFSVSLDTAANVVCLCPQCHRFFHHGKDEDIKKDIANIYDKRSQLLRDAGIVDNVKDFVRFALLRFR